MKTTVKESTRVDERPCITIRIRANYSQQVEDGVYQLSIPTTELSKEEGALLDKLFPNTGNQIERLLKVEALMDAITS